MGDIVLSEKQGHIVYITTNRPEKRNILNRALVEGLKTAWTEYSQEELGKFNGRKYQLK